MREKSCRECNCTKKRRKTFVWWRTCANGEGVPEDDAEAVRWYRMAAEQGLAPAQFILGLMYANGEGVPQNYVRAYAWFNLAAAQGYEGAVSAKAAVEGLMTAAQIAEAQELSTTLFARINGGG